MSISDRYSSGPVWFLVQLKPNSHKIAERNLARQKFEIFCPMVAETKRQKGRFIKAERPIFPGYMFVRFDPSQGSWEPIKSTRGVLRLVSFDDSGPSVVSAALMDELFSRFGPDQESYAEALKPGVQVRLADGPFTDFFATIENVVSKDRVWVLLNILGQQARIQLTRQQLSA